MPFYCKIYLEPAVLPEGDGLPVLQGLYTIYWHILVYLSKPLYIVVTAIVCIVVAGKDSKTLDRPAESYPI